ncbi:Aste57867_15983 [Aphanomyces stellatus]|uniref:Aste57867_15983 protein n=1 Tax=Aphanomyces stellatus TaxID=120398 RepID=A0A485L4F9_9STRA|nr:hypothetical protein As57867_015927 [Aphanomyces stellatus]VFT92768.1 Aste57867_15983 [Aphanomyces stellatus]
MSGFGDLVHLAHLDVPGRYLVVKTEWRSRLVYFHNVYAPVDSQLRGAFFHDLPRDFEPDSFHLVGGDFNLPFNPALDTTSSHARHYQGRADCVEWLTTLGVVDAWRNLHP